MTAKPSSLTMNNNNETEMFDFDKSDLSYLSWLLEDDFYQRVSRRIIKFAEQYALEHRRDLAVTNSNSLLSTTSSSYSQRDEGLFSSRLAPDDERITPIVSHIQTAYLSFENTNSEGIDVIRSDLYKAAERCRRRGSAELEHLLQLAKQLHLFEQVRRLFTEQYHLNHDDIQACLGDSVALSWLQVLLHSVDTCLTELHYFAGLPADKRRKNPFLDLRNFRNHQAKSGSTASGRTRAESSASTSSTVSTASAISMTSSSSSESEPMSEQEQDHSVDQLQVYDSNINQAKRNLPVSYLRFEQQRDAQETGQRQNNQANNLAAFSVWHNLIKIFKQLRHFICKLLLIECAPEAVPHQPDLYDLPIDSNVLLNHIDQRLESPTLTVSQCHEIGELLKLAAQVINRNHIESLPYQELQQHIDNWTDKLISMELQQIRDNINQGLAMRVANYDINNIVTSLEKTYGDSLNNRYDTSIANQFLCSAYIALDLYAHHHTLRAPTIPLPDGIGAIRGFLSAYFDTFDEHATIQQRNKAPCFYAQKHNKSLVHNASRFTEQYCKQWEAPTIVSAAKDKEAEDSETSGEGCLV